MELEQKLQRLARIRVELKKYATLKAEEDQLKAEVLFEMNLNRSKRTEAVAGVYAVRAERIDVRVTDPDKVENWLSEHKFDIDEYKRLDLTRVTPLVKANLKETGEIPEGTELVHNEYISIKDAKE